MSTKLTILLVEDDPFLREATRLLLEDAGYGVREAASAAQALEQFETERPSLVLLDLGLPDRSGLDLARDLLDRAEPHGLRIVALTGRGGAGERDRCLRAGCCDYLAKPVDARLLIQRLPELIAHPT